MPWVNLAREAGWMDEYRKPDNYYYETKNSPGYLSSGWGTGSDEKMFATTDEQYYAAQNAIHNLLTDEEWDDLAEHNGDYDWVFAYLLFGMNAFEHTDSTQSPFGEEFIDALE